MEGKLRSATLGCFAVATLLLAVEATAQGGEVLGFYGLTSNNVGDVAIGEAQLTVEVTDVAPGQVGFIFRNAGPDASSITDVYFDDGTLLGIAQIIDADDGIGGDPGVDFSQGASPPELPSSQNATPVFETTQGFLADSDAPAQPNGVNPGEELTIIFNLINGKTYDDTIAALIQGGGVGGLRIGIHVQGFASGGSETFINNPPGTTPGPGVVPEPSSMALMAIGLFGLAGYGWRKRQSQAA